MGFTPLSAFHFEGQIAGRSFHLTIDRPDKNTRLFRIAIDGVRPNGGAGTNFMCGSTVNLTDRHDTSVARVVERIQQLIPLELDSDCTTAVRHAVQSWLVAEFESNL
jgi:hypothetical protein